MALKTLMQQKIPRRRFITIMTGVLGTLISWCSFELIRDLFWRARLPEKQKRFFFCKIQDLQQKFHSATKNYYLDETHNVLVIRKKTDVPVESRFHFLSILCTHLQCRLNITIDARQLICPCHGSVFSLDESDISDIGRVMKGPACKNLTHYRAFYSDDKIYLEC